MIFWEGWLLKSNENNKWRYRRFRVRDKKLEFIGQTGLKWDGNDFGGSAAETGLVSPAGGYSHVGDGSRDSDVGSDRGIGYESENLRPSDSKSVHDSSYIKLKPGGSEDELEAEQCSDVAKEVGEAPKGRIDLENEVLAFFVLGSNSALQPSTGNSATIGRNIELTSGVHMNYHKGPIKALIVCLSGKKTWRIGVGSNGGKNFSFLLSSIGLCMPRGVVLAAGWIQNPGTINWNRRYALLLSTGNLMIFKDPSLDNLRRDLWLGEDGCTIESLSSLTSKDSFDEQAFWKQLSNSNQQSVRELLTLRVNHPAVAEKGYLISIERAYKNESVSAYCARFCEWVRLLKAAAKQSSVEFSIPGRTWENPGYLARMQTLRTAFESREILQQYIMERTFAASPACYCLAKAGFPCDLRPAVWIGRCRKLFKHAGLHNLQASDHASNCDRFLETSRWLVLVDNLCPEFSRRSKRCIVELFLKMKEKYLSVELVSVANFICSIVARDSDALVCLQVIAYGFCFYYSRFTSIPSAALCSLAVDHPDSKVRSRVSDMADDCSPLSKSLATAIDVEIIFDLVRSRYPSFSLEKLIGCKPIVARWVSSLLTYKVPFGWETSQRVWDFLLLVLDNGDWLAGRIFVIRVCVAIFCIHSDILQRVDDWCSVLSANSENHSNHSENHECGFTYRIDADQLLFIATKDRWLLRLTTRSVIQERQAAFQVEVADSARTRLEFLQKWVNVVEDIWDLCVNIRRVIASISDESASIISMTSSTLAEDLAERCNVEHPIGSSSNAREYFGKGSEASSVEIANALLPLVSNVVSIEEVLELLGASLINAQTEVSRHTGQNRDATEDSTGFDLMSVLDNVTSCSNVLSFGGEVSIRSSLFEALAKSVISMGWNMIATGDRCLCIADRAAYRSLSMHVRWTQRAEGSDFATHAQNPSESSFDKRRVDSPDSFAYAHKEGAEIRERASRGRTLISRPRMPTGESASQNHSFLQIQSQEHGSSVLRSSEDHAYQSLLMKSRLNSPSAAYSLSSLADMFLERSPSKATGAEHFGRLLHDTFFHLLQGLLGEAEKIAQCAVSTSMDYQRSKTMNSFASRLFLSDLFDEEVNRLEKVIPFLIIGVEELRKSTLKEKRCAPNRCAIAGPVEPLWKLDDMLTTHE